MDDAQWEKIQNARGPWVSLKGRQSGEWPGWVRKLDVELQAWLDGESVDYAVFDFEFGENQYADSAFESAELWALILSTRFVVHVKVAKINDSQNGAASVAVIPRSAITSLSLKVLNLPGAQGIGLVTRAEFDGLQRPLQIPDDEQEWYLVPPEDRVRIFASLRDDLYPRPS